MIDALFFSVVDGEREYQSWIDVLRADARYPEVPGVVVILNSQVLPRLMWATYDVEVADLLDAKSGTVTIKYIEQGVLRIQRVDA